MELDITKLTSKGQVVIPQEIREAKNLKTGERFLVYDTEDAIILKRISNLQESKSLEEFEKTFAKTWNIATAKNLSREDVEEEILNYRKEKNA